MSTCSPPDRAAAGGFIDYDQISRFSRPYEIVRAFATSFRTSPRTAFARQIAEYLAAYRDVRPIPAHGSARMIDLYITVQAGETHNFTMPDGKVRGMVDHACAGNCGRGS